MTVRVTAFSGNTLTNNCNICMANNILLLSISIGIDPISSYPTVFQFPESLSRRLTSDMNVIQLIIAFFAVTLDEFVTLILFFSKCYQNDGASDGFTILDVFLGHVLGFSVVIGISFICSSASWMIPIGSLKWLGLFPLGLGLYDLIKRINRACNPRPSNTTTKDNEESLLLHDQRSSQNKSTPTKDYDTLNNNTEEVSSSSIEQYIGHFFRPNVWKVAGVALSEASEEVTVFAPLFALATQSTSSRGSFVIILILFYSLLFLEIFVAYFCSYIIHREDSYSGDATQSGLRRSLSSLWTSFVKFGLPLILIGLGLSILLA